LKCFGKEIKMFDVRGVECWFLAEGSTRAVFKSEGTHPVVRDELMREVRNGRRSPEMVWRKEEGMVLVVRQPDLISSRISSGERGAKEVKA
jgi:hypothetical protein